MIALIFLERVVDPSRKIILTDRVQSMAAITSHPLVQQVRSLSEEDMRGDLVHGGHHLFGLIWINPQRLGGTPCFYGTRVPIKTLFDYIDSGHTLSQFLDDFDGVTEEQARAVVHLAESQLLGELPTP